MQETANQKLSNIIDNVLNEFDAICDIDTNITYDLYSHIHNLISNIYNEFID